MKLLLFIALWGLLTVLFSGSPFPHTQKDFEVMQSYKHIYGGYQKTVLNVRLTDARKYSEDIFEEVKKSYDKMNGEADELTIYLFISTGGKELGYLDEKHYIRKE